MRILGDDVSLFSIDGANLLARLTSCEMTISRDFVDVSGIAEGPWGVYRPGSGEIEVSAETIIHDCIEFYDIVFNATEVYLEFGWTDGTATLQYLYMYCYCGQDNWSFGGRGEAATESVNFRPSRPDAIQIKTCP